MVMVMAMGVMVVMALEVVMVMVMVMAVVMVMVMEVYTALRIVFFPRSEPCLCRMGLATLSSSPPLTVGTNDDEASSFTNSDNNAPNDTLVLINSAKLGPCSNEEPNLNKAKHVGDGHVESVDI